jgi:hypothetical protein
MFPPTSRRIVGAPGVRPKRGELGIFGKPEVLCAFCPERQSSICRAHQRNMRHWSIESMNVPNHLLLQVCGPNPTQAGTRDEVSSSTTPC